MRALRSASGLPWIVAVAVAAAPVAVRACGSCYSLGGNPLSLPHPKAIEVAVATRRATESGLIAERTTVTRDSLLEGGRGYVDLQGVSAPRLVEGWATRLARSTPEGGPLAVYFLFIDTEQGCGLISRGGEVVFDGNPTFHVDARVITTRPAFQAVTSGALDAAEAERQGLLLIEGDVRARLLFRNNVDAPAGSLPDSGD